MWSYIYVLALIVACLFLAPSTGFSALEGCEVGNTSTGRWQGLEVLTHHECPLSGPANLEKEYRVGFNVTGDAVSSYRCRIEGRLLMIAFGGVDGWHYSPPPTRPECITGYAEEMATSMARSSNSGIHAKSSLLYYKTSSRVQYLRAWDCGIRLYEWRCNEQQPISKPNNQGPPLCPLP